MCVEKTQPDILYTLAFPFQEKGQQPYQLPPCFDTFS